MKLATEHRRWMREAIKEASLAPGHGDVPVGAVVVRDGKVLGRGHNSRELLKDPTAHAEMIALTAACSEAGDWRLDDCTLYVTLEPCPMCAAALRQARVKRLVFGAFEPVMGAVESKLKLLDMPGLGPRVEVIAPVMEAECAALLADFFSDLRGKKDVRDA